MSAKKKTKKFNVKRHFMKKICEINFWQRNNKNCLIKHRESNIIGVHTNTIPKRVISILLAKNKPSSFLMIIVDSHYHMIKYS